MKRKMIAAALATLMVFGTASSASARHLAEEYAERVQLERRERLEEESAAARRQAQAEARRQAWEERERRAEEEDRRFIAEDEDDQEAIEAEIVEIGRPAQEAAEARAEEERAVAEAERAKAEARERERLSKEAREREEAERKRSQEDAERRKLEEKAAREQVRQNREKESDVAEEANATGENFLQQFLRRAKERTQSVSAAAEQPPLHAAKPQPMKILKADHVDTGGTLIFSDSPEYVKKPGILYTDTVKGEARVFYYHLNETGKKCKIAVVLESVGGQYAVVHVTRRAVAPPSENYFQVGKGLQQTYFSDEQGVDKIYIASGERRLLLEDMDKTIVPPGSLVSGMVDFTASAPVRVSVLCYPVDKKPLTYIDETTVLPSDEHKLRGTFVGMDRIVRLNRYDPEEDGVVCVVFADNEYDKYCEGVDATDGSLATNSGNYGILYRIETSTRGKTKYLMSTMGGAFAGAVRVEAGASGNKLVNVPDGSMFFGQDSVHPPIDKNGMTTLLTSVDLSEIGSYRAKPPIFFEFSPPGASNLPVMLILAPEDLKLERTGTGQNK